MPALTEPQLTDRERQIAKEIQFLNAPKTPFTSLLKVRPTIVDSKLEQVVQEYERAGFTGVKDNVDASNFHSNTGQVITFRAQKYEHAVAVSDLVQETATATTKKGGAINEQVLLSLEILKEKQEAAYSSDNEASTETDSTPTQTRGVFRWATTGPTATIDPVPDKYRTPDAQVYNGTLATLSDDALTAIGNAIFKSRRGGTTAMKLFCGVDFHSAITQSLTSYVPTATTPTSAARTTREQDDTSVVKVVDLVKLNNITFELHDSAFLRLNPANGEDTDYTHKSAFAIDMDMAFQAYMRLPKPNHLEYKGGGQRAVPNVISLFGLKNPKAIATFNISA
jgi:hypothetical protein